MNNVDKEWLGDFLRNTAILLFAVWLLERIVKYLLQ